MHTRQNIPKARKACLRCRRSKRRCDRALPQCILCKRRQEDCQYENITLSSSASALIPDHDPAFSLDNGVASQQLKAAIIRKLADNNPQDVVRMYSRTLKFWFPIIAESRLSSQLSDTWDNATLDFTLLCLGIVLFCSPPKTDVWRITTISDPMALYLFAKSCIALVDGIGINSIEVIQSRLLVTTFEVSHGFFPAAYISIGATVRAGEMIRKRRNPATSLSRDPTEEQRIEEGMTWAAIKVLDRYIAIISGEFPPLTRHINERISDLPYSELPFVVCPIFLSISFSSQRQFLRLFESTNLLDKVHITIHQPTQQTAFNLEEASLLVKTLNSLRTVIEEEVPHEARMYSSGLLICITGLLLIYDKCDKERSFNYNMEEHLNSATASLDSIIDDIYNIVNPFESNMHTIDLDSIPPFAVFIIYKAATIVTNRLRDQSEFKKNIEILGVFRDFLNLINTQWLAAGYYLNLLNEDTTPRILKALKKDEAEI